MRVGIIGLSHESNTFIDTPTTIQNFRQGQILVGEQITEHFAPAHHEIGGFLQALGEQDLKAVPIFAARATPSGVITADALDELLEMMLTDLKRAGALDGLLVAAHGAAVSENHRDMDGYWLSVLREKLGPRIPIICTIDPHANVSRRMVEATDALIAYRSNPHLDQRERGIEAGNLMAATLAGRITPVQRASLPPIQINIERQATSEPHLQAVYDLANSMLQRPGILSDSVLLGFPYADVLEMGSGFIVVTDNDPELAQRCADELERFLLDHREDFVGRLVSIDEAIDQVEGGAGPVALLDMGDNLGGGSPGDGTLIAHALARRGIRGGFACLFDADAAHACFTAGAGAKVALDAGGRHLPVLGPPLHVKATVRSLHDGKFTEPQARHGGHRNFDLGPTAIIDSDDGLTLMLTSKRMMPVSLHQLTSMSLDPATFRAIVVKGVHAPVAAYAEACPRLIRVNTPGPTTADMLALKYHHRRRPLFPFEEIE
jgi:microcystin degradation protein MlrC